MTNPFTQPEPAAEVRQAEATHETVRAMALRKLEQIKELKAKRKEIRESKKNLLDSDVLLADALDAAIERNNEIKQLKAKVTQKPEYVQNALKEKELSEEINELSESLTNNLVQYTQMTGASYIEDAEGNELKIKHKITVSSGQQRLF